MANADFKGTGVKVDGLAESIKALAKVDKKYRKEAVEVFRDAAKSVQQESQKAIGRVGRYPKRRGMIGRSATGKGAGVTLNANKYPWALGAEYGEQVANVPRKYRGGRGGTQEWPQTALKRRTFGIWRPPTSVDMFVNRGGYMIQPVLRRRLPAIENDVATKLNVITNKALRSAGVPR